MRADVLFPYDGIRPEQDRLLDAVDDACRIRGQLVVHAPTGLGKTVGALGPAIAEAVRSNKVVLFLTSRHTHHALAMQTVRDIRKAFDVDARAVDIIGKKHLCSQGGVSALGTRRFNEFCRALRERDECEFFLNVKQGEKVTPEAQHAVQMLSSGDFTLDRVRAESEIRRLCPYEIAMLVARSARVIIADYYYIFHPSIREGFLKRIQVPLEDVILVLDEGHNLPERIKELASDSLNTSGVSRAVQEARKLGMDDLAESIAVIGDAMAALGEDVSSEAYADRERFIAEVEQKIEYDTLIARLAEASSAVREEHRVSVMGAIASFLEIWASMGAGFTRIIAKEQGTLAGYELSVRCLDPAIFSRDVVSKCHATILMSGTLLPTAMYRELLGLDGAKELVLRSPFPRENRLTIVVPKTSTRYAQRSDQQYQDIAQLVSRSLHSIPGNVAVFFPSYAVRDEISRRVVTAKAALLEEPGMSLIDKKGVLERLKALRAQGAVLFGVMGGSFSEGVDYPGDLLKGVIIVGLPLQRPDLETKALIAYYDGKFGKGWEYGYAFPAFNRMLQSAGRCIRTETDRGVVILIDERYGWRGYAQLFPPDWDVKTSLLFESFIERFFLRPQQ